MGVWRDRYREFVNFPEFPLSLLNVIFLKMVCDQCPHTLCR